jgi:hypothetical protein
MSSNITAREASSLRSSVLAAARVIPSPTRVQGRIAARVLTSASAAVGVTVFEGSGGLRHCAGRPLSITVVLATGWMVVAALLTWLVVGRGGSTLARRPLLVAGAALATPLLLFLWMHLFYGSYVEPFELARAAAAVPGRFNCLRYTLFISALPLASFLILRRGVEPRYPGVLGAGAGAACAAWAGALVDLRCPLTNSSHVLIGHVAPLAVAMVVGAAFGHFTLGVRRIRTRS